ncbi:MULTISPECIES: hypothetical protein [unclassified Coleofasciculus]|uniref:hypothetical protein n=1 Tax=unclassified Coleofasciculus TaxID=2692782 RepID=UPI00188017B2|nr:MULTISPECIES: hypothetical protein [unclassified Coleofasciculus]MBE9125201.1 hypothetical protein [Coleofasciculus sp. LEGE 07081]MBE9148778.1 hypothetical protein [Coleofasciculus sp. LEGE 07092]
MKINKKLVAILAFTIALLPTPVLANAGTPLMWTGFGHLFIGNAVIGTIEGLLLSRLFNTPRSKSVNVLVLANYASAWLGMVLILDRLSHISTITIENVYVWLWLFVGIAFILTLFIEYPFFWFLLRKQQKAVQKALKATLLIHGISYLLLFGWYGLNSQTSLLTQLDVVSAEQLQPSKDYRLYFITSDGKQVVQSNLDGKNQESIKDVIATDRNDRLSICKNEEEKFDLVVNAKVILSDLASLASIPEPPERYNCVPYPFGAVPKLTENTNWDYETFVWAAGGIMGYNEPEKLRFGFALETPFVFWNVSNATHLDGDFIVFQLGNNQVCILQPHEKRIALIARGRSPVVVKPKQSD